MTQVTALLLAAGFGTRLGAVTRSIPKPLIEIGDKRLIDFALYQIRKAGIKKVIVNLHHLGARIEDYLGDGSRWGLTINYSNEDPILGTGGAIKKVLRDGLISDQETIMVYNSDALFGDELDLKKFVEDFTSHKSVPLAGMLLTQPPNPNPFSVIGVTADEELYRVVSAPGSALSGVPSTQELVYTGIQLFKPRISSYTSMLGDNFCSIRDLYPLLFKNGEFILGHLYSGFWQDTGTPERVEEAKRAFKDRIIKA